MLTYVIYPFVLSLSKLIIIKLKIKSYSSIPSQHFTIKYRVFIMLFSIDVMLKIACNAGNLTWRGFRSNSRIT